jgi:ubiquinone/menaquinone biosynthesis C-methylase UbiE
MHNPHHLRHRQYASTSNLEARIAIHQRFSTAALPWLDWLFDRIPLAPGLRVLDVGAGTGILWHEHRQHLPAGLRLTIADLSPGMIASATALLGDLLDDAIVANAEDLPFGNGTFDLVVANHMLYHVPDIDRAIGEFVRVLAPDGVLVAATNGERHMIETWDLITQVTGRAPDRRVATRFSLEHGAEKLARHVRHVARQDFPDSLRVTDPDAVVAYLASTAAEDHLTEDHLSAAREIVAEAIAACGAFTIQKAAGVFICQL